MASWDATRVKAQLRLTAQRLGQLQDKLEATGQITRRDITTLLQQNNLILARAKAQKLIREDIYADLLQTLEMHLSIVSEHMGEFERSGQLSPVVVEAAASIIFAAQRVDSRDLHIVREMLMQQLGMDFARAASDKGSGYVPERIFQAVSAPPPSAATLDYFLYKVARSSGVQWLPDWQPHEKVDAISSMLDPSSIPEIDISRLRTLCSHGLPQYPPWLRPRVWRLLLGTLPPNKKSWHDDARKQRDNYYDLLRRLLEPFDILPPPSQPLAPQDALLVEASKALIHVPHALYAKLEEEPDKSEGCPLDETAPDELKIACAWNLDARLRLIRGQDSPNDNTAHEEAIPEIRLESTPEIRLESTESDTEELAYNRPENDEDENHQDGGSTPSISLSAPDSPHSASSAAPTTLLASRAYTPSGAHPKHSSALLRLLYVHYTLNPANRAPQVASLLVPLYSALAEEIEPEDAAHVEADAFWLFEAMVGEFAELEDPEGANAWMAKMGERLQIADTELAEDLQTKGLDPALPHYSYRWLTTLLTHTVPLSELLTIWDALFSQPMRERDTNAKLDYLVDICTSMILCARSPLILLGRPPIRLMNFDENTLLTRAPLGEREIEDAFARGMALLQAYSLKNAGGVERVLQLAFDLSKQRMMQTPAAPAKPTASLASRWRQSIWGAPVASAPAPPLPPPPPVPPVPEVPEEEDSDSTTSESEDEHTQHAKPLPPPPSIQAPQQATLSARLAQTVWKGITNQAAMEPPPSPMSPAFSPVQSPATRLSALPEEPPLSPASSDASAASKRSSAIWSYAEKFRDSDAAATLAKVSTNWRVKALDAWSKRASVSTDAQLAPHSAPPTASLSPSWVPSSAAAVTNRASLQVAASPRVYEPKRSSLPEGDRSSSYSPPARPAFFRPVRDSIIPDLRDIINSPTGSEISALSGGSHDSLRNARRESMGTTGTASPSGSARSGGPRPLLLNSSSLITHSRASTTDSQFAETVRDTNPPNPHRSSASSVSSLSPSEHTSTSTGRPHAGGTVASRVIPLNRKTQSPMARVARRQESVSSTSSPSGSLRRLPNDTSPDSDDRRSHGRHGWRTADVSQPARQMSMSSASPPPPPGTPPNGGTESSVHVVSSEAQRGSVVLSELDEPAASQLPDMTSKLHRKSNASLSRLQIDDSSDSSVAQQAPMRSARVRSKRHPPRLASLRTRDGSKGTVVDRAPSPNTLAAPEWPEESDATTPKAAHFEGHAGGAGMSTSPSSRRVRKLSSEGHVRTRKVSTDGSTHSRRKVSSERKHKRDSSAVEGDDEGYDELLSAYESEDSVALE